MLKNKRGIIAWEDFFQGLLLGFIIGAVVVYLGVKGIIPIPFLK